MGNINASFKCKSFFFFFLEEGFLEKILVIVLQEKKNHVCKCPLSHRNIRSKWGKKVFI